MSINGMRYFHVNTRSLFGKLRQLELLYAKADILCCTETWLDNRFTNDCVRLPDKTIFRCDRLKNITSLNARPTAGGVCIYIANTWANYTVCIEACSTVTPDYEILTLVTTRPDHRFFATICVYKPPKGNLNKCIKFLYEILDHNRLKKKEIWILGDFNTDLVKRDNPNTVSLLNFAKKSGLRQLINEITRPNVRGGACIDHILSNSSFVSQSGVLDDMVADHFTVYAIRKKRREKKLVTCDTVRDYCKFDNTISAISLRQWIGLILIITLILQPNGIFCTNISTKYWL